MRKRRRWKQGRLRSSKGLARIEHGRFESLESRTPLAADGFVCLAPGMHQSSAGEFFYIDAEPAVHTPPQYIAQASAARVSVERVPFLHSDQDAAQKIYLDFNGHTVSGTGWNELNRGQTINAPAFDVDGDRTSFSEHELAIIENIWARVSEDFAPFDIDVTTEPPSPRALRAGSQALRVLISSNIDSKTGRNWMPTGNGVAYLNSWRTAGDTPVWIFSNRLGASDKIIAESVSHEVGHAFGLHHDGLHVESGEEEIEYFEGHGSGATGWASIMGLGYHQPVTQWDTGQYQLSNNQQRDIEVIASEQNGVRIRPDDYPNNLIFAALLNADSTHQIDKSGLISTQDDRDAFRLELEPGTLDLLFSPAAKGANLDLQVSLFDQRGMVIETFRSDTQGPTHVRANVTAGTHYLVVDGIGRGDPASNGYSDYGSIGRYTISGTLPKPEVTALTQIRSAARRLLTS